jgi:uncharacterized coiled-coil protein SlyX
VDERLQIIEEKIAYLERTIGDLDEVVRRLSSQIDKLQRQWKEVREAATPVDPNRTQQDDVPPHYGPPSSR